MTYHWPLLVAFVTLYCYSMNAVRDVRWCRLSEWLTGTRVYRKVSEAILRAQARLRLARLESCRIERSQLMALQWMLHRARQTPFGQEHDFRRIGSVSDYQRLVPLSTPQSLWSRYWHRAEPEPTQATWPEAETQLAGMHDGHSVFHLPVSPSLVQAHWKALRTALALVTTHTTRHLSGDILFLGPSGHRVDALLATGATPLLSSRIRLGRESRARETEVRPDEADSVQAVTPVNPSPNVSCILADRDRFGRLLRSLHWQTGKKHVREIWPELSAVILTSRCTPTPGDISDEPALQIDGVEVRGACLPLEAPLAVEDHRHNGLRVLADLDTFLEFIPVEELDQLRPSRHTLVNIEPGHEYAAAFTSPAGLWSCVSGLRVMFEKLEPLLLKWVRQDAITLRTREDDVTRAFPSNAVTGSTTPPAVHPLRNDTSAAPRGKISRTSWLRRADRE